MKVYLASPFFNEEQVEREERIKKKLRELGITVLSPKEFCFCPSDASNELREKTFRDNLKHIKEADAIFAITNGKDMGTIFEAGYGYGINKPIIYFCEGLNGQFNLMLAQSGNVVLTNDSFTLESIQSALNGNKVKFKGAIE